MHYDLVDLRLLVHVADLGGFAAAARRNNIAASALSERMRKMEASAGAKFFSRTTRGSTPTPFGFEVIQHAREIVRQSDRLNEAVDVLKGRDQPPIRMLANSNAMSSFLPDILSAFMSRHPDAVIDLRESTSDEIGEALRSDTADVGIRAAMEGDGFDFLELTPFRRDRLMLIVPIGHELSWRDEIAFEEILDEPFIGLGEGSAIQTYLSQQAERLGRSLRVRIRLRDFDAVCKLVGAGAGIAILPMSSYMASPSRLGCKAATISDPWARRDLFLCTRRDRPGPKLVRVLIDEISQVWPAADLSDTQLS